MGGAGPVILHKDLGLRRRVVHPSCCLNISQPTLWRTQSCKVTTENQVTRKPVATYLCDHLCASPIHAPCNASVRFLYHNCSKSNPALSTHVSFWDPEVVPGATSILLSSPHVNIHPFSPSLTTELGEPTSMSLSQKLLPSDWPEVCFCDYHPYLSLRRSVVGAWLLGLPL